MVKIPPPFQKQVSKAKLVKLLRKSCCFNLSISLKSLSTLVNASCACICQQKQQLMHSSHRQQHRTSLFGQQGFSCQLRWCYKSTLGRARGKSVIDVCWTRFVSNFTGNPGHGCHVRAQIRWCALPKIAAKWQDLPPRIFAFARISYHRCAARQISARDTGDVDALESLSCQFTHAFTHTLPSVGERIQLEIFSPVYSYLVGLLFGNFEVTCAQKLCTISPVKSFFSTKQSSDSSDGMFFSAQAFPDSVCVVLVSSIPQQASVFFRRQTRSILKVSILQTRSLVWDICWPMERI